MHKAGIIKLAQSSKLMQGIPFDFPLNINHRKKMILALFFFKWVGRAHPFFEGKALGTRLGHVSENSQ